MRKPKVVFYTFRIEGFNMSQDILMNRSVLATLCDPVTLRIFDTSGSESRLKISLYKRAPLNEEV